MESVSEAQENQMVYVCYPDSGSSVISLDNWYNSLSELFNSEPEDVMYAPLEGCLEILENSSKICRDKSDIYRGIINNISNTNRNLINNISNTNINSIILAVNNNTGIASSVMLFRYTTNPMCEQNILFLQYLCSNERGGGSNLLNLLKKLARIIKIKNLSLSGTISGILLQSAYRTLDSFYTRNGFNKIGVDYYFWNLDTIGGKKSRRQSNIVKKYSKKSSSKKIRVLRKKLK